MPVHEQKENKESMSGPKSGFGVDGVGDGDTEVPGVSIDAGAVAANANLPQRIAVRVLRASVRPSDLTFVPRCGYRRGR